MASSSVVISLDVVADDFGYCEARNRSIADCFAAGAISRASLLVNFAASAAAGQLARQLSLPVGLHLNLTEGTPVGEPSSLCDPQQPGCVMRGKLGLRAAWRDGAVRSDDVRREVGAQLERFRALVGHWPRWVDGHQHVHVVPGLAELVVDALAQCAAVLAVRVPVLRSADERDALTPFLRQVVDQARDVEPLLRARFPHSNDLFLGLTSMGGLSSVDAVCRSLARERQCLLDAGAVLRAEWMVHPGYISRQAYADDFATSPDREHEHRLLCEAATTLRALPYIQYAVHSFNS